MKELIIEKIDGYDVIACPFCGKSELTLHESIHAKSVHCIHCQADGPTGLRVSDAIFAWNTRYATDKTWFIVE